MLDAETHPVDTSSAPSAWEHAAVHAAREVHRLVEKTSARCGARRRRGRQPGRMGRGRPVPGRRAGRRSSQRSSACSATTPLLRTPTSSTSASSRHLDALGRPDDPRAWSSAAQGRGSSVASGAAQVDREGNLNSTDIPGGPFLVGSGGANDVASRAAACLAVVLARPERLVERAGYVTSPGRNLESVATDRGVLRKHEGVLRIEAVAAGAEPLADRVARFAGSCGWDVEVARAGSRSWLLRIVPRCWRCAVTTPRVCSWPAVDPFQRCRANPVCRRDTVGNYWSRNSDL